MLLRNLLGQEQSALPAHFCSTRKHKTTLTCGKEKLYMHFITLLQPSVYKVLGKEISDTCEFLQKVF